MSRTARFLLQIVPVIIVGLSGFTNGFDLGDVSFVLGMPALALVVRYSDILWEQERPTWQINMFAFSAPLIAALLWVPNFLQLLEQAYDYGLWHLYFRFILIAIGGLSIASTSFFHFDHWSLPKWMTEKQNIGIILLITGFLVIFISIPFKAVGLASVAMSVALVVVHNPIRNIWYWVLIVLTSIAGGLTLGISVLFWLGMHDQIGPILYGMGFAMSLIGSILLKQNPNEDRPFGWLNNYVPLHLR